ncbi:MFS transporter [Amorphus sp. MBR-141]
MTEDNSAGRVIWLLTLGIMIIGSNSFVLSPILSDVAASMDTDPVKVARAISAFGAATAVSSFLFAGAAARIGARRVLSLGSLAMAMALAGSAASRSWIELAACQAAIGASVGLMLPTIYGVATSIAPEGQGGQVLGRVIRGWGIALVLGVPFSSLVSDLAGWRTVYGLLAGVAALASLGFRRLPLPDAVSGPRPTIRRLEALRLPGAVLTLSVCLFYMIAFYGLFAYLGDHVRTAFGASASEAGLVVLAYGAGFGTASFAMGAVDRFGPQRVLPAALLLLALIYLGLDAATQRFVTALPAAFVWGFANHVAVNLIILLLSRRGAEARAVLMGWQTTVTYGAIFLGPILLGALYAPFGFGAAAALSAASALVAALLAWTAGRLWQPPR